MLLALIDGLTPSSVPHKAEDDEMATPVIPGDLVETRTYATQAEQTAIMTFHWGINSAIGTVTNDIDFARVIDNTLAPPWKATLSADSSYRGTSARIISSSPPTSPVFFNTSVGPGTGTAPDLPRQTAGLISWQTAFGGRQFRGRTYIGFPWAGLNNLDGVPTGPAITLFTNIAQAMFGLTTIPNVAGTGSCGVNLLLTHRKPKTGTTPAPTFINGYIIRNKWATQRRRGSFGRPNSSPI
jgi:hypothetical protein